jgi:hypothetical protein
MKKIFSIFILLVSIFALGSSVSDFKRKKIASTEIFSSFTTLYMYHDLYPEEDPKGYQDHKLEKLQMVLSEPVTFQKIEFMGYYAYFRPHRPEIGKVLSVYRTNDFLEVQRCINKVKLRKTAHFLDFKDSFSDFDEMDAFNADVYDTGFVY